MKISKNQQLMLCIQRGHKIMRLSTLNQKRHAKPQPAKSQARPTPAVRAISDVHGDPYLEMAVYVGVK